MRASRRPVGAMSFPVSDHCDGRRFYNTHVRADRSLRDLLRWWRTRNAMKWPTSVPLSSHQPPPATVEAGRAAITFVGHSTFLIRTATAVVLNRSGLHGLRRPVWLLRSEAGATPGPRARGFAESGCGAGQPQPLRSPSAIVAARGPVAVPAHVRHDARGRQVSREDRHSPRRRARLVGAGARRSQSGRDVYAVAALLARGLRDRNKTLWGGFAFQSGGLQTYFAGDSGYCPHFKEIGQRLGAIDIALLPIGAYKPRWFMKPMHMNPDEALLAHRDLHARTSIAMHFGTFRLTDESIDDPVRRLTAARSVLNVPPAAFRVPHVGETLVISSGHGSDWLSSPEPTRAPDRRIRRRCRSARR